MHRTIERPNFWYKLIRRTERFIKEALFRFEECVQCILKDNGVVCPKNLRNGPCGGVRLEGHCEVYPELNCV